MLSSISLNAETGEHEHAHTTESFYLPPQLRLGGAGSLLSGPVAGEPFDVAIGFIRDRATQLGLSTSDLDEFVVSSQYTDEGSGTTHIYLRQTFEGLEVMHADISISLTARNEVIHVASSFVRDAQPTDDLLAPFVVNAAAAFQEWSDDKGLDVPVAPRVVSADETAADSETLLALDGTALDDVAAKLVYVPTANGLERAWQLDVHDADYRHWVTAYVSATDGDSLYTNSNVEFATYNVFAFPTVSPITGSRSNVVDPHDTLASPYGWHDSNGVAGAEFTDTRGNNASVQEDGNHDNVGGFRPDGGANLNFDFPLDTAQDPALYQSAAITNAYYWVNLLHDIHYQYGFTEAAGNFQVNNYGRGGIGNDPVIVDIQDGDGGTDGFSTLPDGQSPRMSLYKRDNPYRDRAYDSDIIIHEFGHGISGRLTGGPGNTTALNAIQSKAMGEGWGDWWALMLTQVPTDAKLDAYPLGNYAAGFAPDGPGIRPYPYSFNKAIDPLTYANFNGGTVNNEEHKAGTIWASALWDMNWLLIDKHGFSADMLHGNGGNNLALQLVMDGLKLQGTNPSFLAGRDAILAADVALTGGANQAEIWQAFARRGMGLSASDGGGAGATTVVEAFDVPATIRGTVFRDDDGNGTQSGNEPGLAGRSVYLDKNNNGVQDVPTTTTFTQTPNGPLPDAPNIKFTKTISGLSGVITDVNLTVNVTHPQDGDLYITLISPAGTPVILSNYLGDTGDNFTNTTFDDEAPIFISQGTAPFTGSFKPYFNLSQLDGRDPNGTWTLRFDDRAAGNTGTLVSWSLQISAGNADPVTITDGNGDYTFFGLPNATHHVRDVVPTGFTQTAPANGLRDVVIVNGQSAVDQDFGLRALANVSQVATLQDTMSPPIFITPPANLGATSFRIGGIANGLLFKSDGTTPVNNGAFITLPEGAAGLRFMPASGSTATGHFEVELSANGSSIIPDTSKAFGNVIVGAVGSFTLNKSGVTVTEAGSTETFTAVLNSQPTSNVVLSVTSGDTTEATVGPATLTFTPGNWNVAQTVTVTGVNDALDDGDIVSNVVVAVIDAQSDDAFDPAADKTVAVTTTDNDQSGFTLVLTDGATSVTEAGSTDSFTVVLNAQPTSNVVLSVTSGDTTEATVSAPSLTFTPANWNVAQTVTVTGVDDGLDDGDVASNVTVSVVDASSDNSFDPLPDQTAAVTTIDNDGAGFVIVESGGSTVVSEAKTLDSFTVALTAQPTSNVVIKVTHATVPEPDFSPSTLTFTSANWSTPQTVYVRGVDDLLDDGDTYSALTISVDDAASDNAFDSLPNQSVNVLTLDNDINAGFAITQTEGATIVTEAGSSDLINVALTSQPSSNVVVSITSGDGTETTVSPATLTFTAANWNIAQSVTVTGVNDALDDGDIVSNVTLSIVDASSDDAYDPLTDQLVPVTTSDDDGAGFTITQSGGFTSVTEAGSIDSFTVVLTSQPTSNVVLSVVSSGTTEATVSSSSLTFTSANWNVAQVVTVTGVNDDLTDGEQHSTITLSVVDASSDDVFDPLADQTVSVATTDNDSAGFIVTQSGGSTIVSESGTTDTFTVVLTSQLTSDVLLYVVSSDATEATVSPILLTFTPLNWNVAQTVTVTGVDDDLDDNDQSSTITLIVVDAQSDDAYDPLPNQTLNVTTTDNDGASFTIVESNGSTTVTEAGSLDSFTVVLTAQPTSDVVISASRTNAIEPDVSPSTLTFTTANWNVPQNVYVRGVDDLLDDGDVVSTVTVRVVDDSSDDIYDLVPDQLVNVTTLDDDDAPGVTIAHSNGSTSVTEAGSSDSFTVALKAQPASDVVLSVVSNAPSETTVGSATLVFTTANWNVPQSVTVTGVDDLLDDGDIISTVTLSVIDAQSDDAYDAMLDQTAAVTTTDDDASGFVVTQSDGSTSVTEAGSTDSFTVVLTAQPTSNVVLSVVSGNTTEVSVSAATLTFTAANWNVAQAVTVTGVNDDLDDGDISSLITISVVDAQSDNTFDPLADKTVSITTTDNDASGFVVTQSDSATIVTEAGATDSFTVFLTAKPTSNVVLTISSSDPTEATVTPVTLTFTTSNWSVAQTVTVNGVDDSLADGDQQSTLTISVVDAQSDNTFDPLADQTVIVTTRNVNHAPTITSINAVSLNEDAPQTNSLPFTIGDAETPNSLVVTATSSNQQLIPNGSIVLSQIDATHRAVQVTPAANASGTADITLTVSDGIATTSTSFRVTVTAINDLPTISDVVNQSIDEDGVSGAIALTVRDIETAATSLVVTATSSNQNVLLDSGITLGGSGEERTVTLRPIANRFGSTTITLTVSDGVATATDTFVLTVNSVNDVPTITSLTNRTIAEDTSTPPINFTISDIETPSTQLVVTATSSNAELVPQSGLVLSGTSATRSLVVTPAANRFGTATIYVSVSDGSASRATSFVLSVTSASDVPIVPAATFTVPENSPNGTAVGVISATVPQDEVVSFAISGGNEDGAFALNSTTGELTVANPRRLNFELRQSVALTISATNAGNEVGTGTITVNISDVLNERLLIDPNEFSAGPVVLKRETDNIVARVLSSNVLIDRVPASGLLGIDAIGRNDAADSLLVDLSGGAVLVASLNFNGGTQGATGVDEFALSGGTTQARIVTAFTGPADGQLRFGDVPVASFTGIERLVDRLPVTTRLISLPDGNDGSSLATVLDQNVTRNRLKSTATPTHAELIFSSPTTELTLDGGLGNDSLTLLSTGLTTPRLTLNGSAGNDVLDVVALGIATTINGGDGADTIRGGRGADRLSGEAGADSITGAQGNDSIFGGNDIDLVYGGTGNDFIDGGLGNDNLNGQDGDDSLLGGDGNDFINGALGNDTADGGAGDDNVRGDDGNDSLLGGVGADRLMGGNQNDRLFGGDDADVMYGDAGDDSLDGGAGDDQLRGSLGVDDIDGGLGSDRIFEEADTNFVLIGAQLSSPALGTETGRNIERFNIVGGPGANVLDARRGTVKVYLFGMDGADTLYGTAIADRLDGGAGDDVLSGGAGLDAFIGGTGFDTVYEQANANVTITGLRIVSTVTGDETPLEVERIALVGGIGNNRFDARLSSVPAILLGGKGNDTLLGSTQADVLIGGHRADRFGGIDSLDGGAGVDTFQLDAQDTLIDGSAETVLDNLFATLPNWLDPL